MDICDYSPPTRENYPAITQLVERGYGDGMRAVARLLASGGRFNEMAALIKSEYLVSIAPLFEELGQRQALTFTIGLFGQDLVDKDLDNLSRYLNSFLLGSETSFNQL